MTVRDIVRDYLREHGYDGLYNDAGDCACLIDDLMPCTACEGAYVDECEPGYKTPCDCGGHAFHISASKTKTVRCDRCGKTIEGLESPRATGGFHRITESSAWAGHPGEKILCDECYDLGPQCHHRE